MRSWMVVALALVAATFPTSHVAFAADVPKEPQAAVANDGWPDTPAGRTARDWVAAFNGGETAMKAFLTTHVPADEFRKKPMSERLETYRTNRDRFGRLTLGAVTSSSPTVLDASLIDEDMNAMPYTFTVRKDEPFWLVSITRKEMRGHMGFGGFHH